MNQIDDKRSALTQLYVKSGNTLFSYIHEMNPEEIRDYCLAKPGGTEGFPFGLDVLVFKYFLVHADS